MTGFKTKPTLALLVAALLAAGTGQAENLQSHATITIDGKTYTLTHARAWSWGEFNGIPSIQQVVFAQKPLDDVNYWGSGNAFDDGAYGAVLSFRPSIPFGADAANFQFDLPDHIDLYGVRIDTGIPATFDTEGATATDYTLKDGVLTGKLAWKGEISGGYYDDMEAAWKEPVITAWTMEFSIKPEPTGEKP